MVSILVVGRDGPDIAGLEGELASVEILIAHGVEDTLEKLGRNRRIDAVLLLGEESETAALVQAIREDNPAPPPLFLPFSPRPGKTPPGGARPLHPGPARELVLELVREIGS